MKHLMTLLVLATLCLACGKEAPNAPQSEPSIQSAPSSQSADTVNPTPTPSSPATIQANTPSPQVAVAPPTPVLAPTPIVEEKPAPDAANLNAALAEFKGRFGDQDASDPLPDGLVLFGFWSLDHLKWSELKALPQTKRTLVMKDSDEERGKGLCVTGRILEIEVEKTEKGKFAHAGIISNMDVTKVVAVGSTGELVEGKTATFCGVVIGKHSYANSGGGQTHTVRLVGMFDLPANRNR